MSKPELTSEVAPYTQETLRKFISRRSGASEEHISQSFHELVLTNYLRDLKVRTIVFEADYIDRDYLTDFSSFYSRCFRDYGKFCSRIHFFYSEFELDLFKRAITGDDAAASVVRDGYAGFLVVKPLPRSFIGRTCLANYSGEDARCFPCSFDIDVSLFGLRLCVQSFPFQSQDRATAACATSALWSSFQCAALRFRRLLQAPVEITAAARSGSGLLSRSIPSSGLNIRQMIKACESISLDPEVFIVSELRLVRLYLRAYLALGIPVVMGFTFDDAAAGSDSHHAVAVTGYRLDPFSQRTWMVSDRISKLYVHDDQLGPFSRMSFTEKEPEKPATLSTSWEDVAGNVGDESVATARPWAFIIPVHPDIRVSAEEIMNRGLAELGQFARIVLRTDRLAGDEHSEIEVDLVLDTSTRLKERWSRSALLPLERKVKLVTKALPRFLWSATLSNSNGVLIEIVYDATDTPKNKEPLLLIVAQPDAWLDFGERMLYHEGSLAGWSSMTDYLLDRFKRQHAAGSA